MTPSANQRTSPVLDSRPLKGLVHFLDHEILHSFRIEKLRPARVQRELVFAFRVGLLLAQDGVVIPSSHRFESKYALPILIEHKPFADLALIDLASNTLDISELFQQKQNQYRADPDRHPSYFRDPIAKVEREGIGRWVLKESNSTEDIKEAWITSIGDSKIWGQIYKHSQAASTAQFEKDLVLVPERLQGKAFVADFVLPLMETTEASPIVARFINTLIQRAYISSFAEGYSAACLSDLPLFDTSKLLPPSSRQYSVSRAKRYFFQRGNLTFIQFCSAEELLQFRFSESWRNEWSEFCEVTWVNPYEDLRIDPGGIMELKRKQIESIESHLNECVEILEACYQDTLEGAVLRRSARKKIKEVNELMSERENELLALLIDVNEADRTTLKRNLAIARDPDTSEEAKQGARTAILNTARKIGDKVIDVGADFALKLMLRSAGLDSG
jgi:hypothetical protein